MERKSWITDTGEVIESSMPHFAALEKRGMGKNVWEAMDKGWIRVRDADYPTPIIIEGRPEAIDTHKAAILTWLDQPIWFGQVILDVYDGHGTTPIATTIEEFTEMSVDDLLQKVAIRKRIGVPAVRRPDVDIHLYRRKN